MKSFEGVPDSDSSRRLSTYEFTFETFLQDSRDMEPDRNPSCAVFDSQSLAESIARYEEENGRTYHSYHSGSYHFPNDPTETERLDEQHRILRLILDGKNYLAPLSPNNPPSRILDIATGTGTWAIEMGDEFPESQIIGTDLSPIQPAYVPPNVRFFVDDSGEDWIFPHPFSYIHTRLTLGCWSDMRHQIIRKAYDNLLPGGHLEAQEISCLPQSDDGTLGPASAFLAWTREIGAASDGAGRQLFVGPELKGWMEDAGFVDVREVVYKVPVNGWPAGKALKHVGEMWQRNLLDGLSGFSLALLGRCRGRTVEEIEVQLVDVRRELFDTRIHAYQKLYVVWGRKPEV